MVVRKKDGSLYRVRGPNKIMLSQELWSDDIIEMVNFEKFDKIVIDSHKRSVKILKSPEAKDDTFVLSPSQAADFFTPPKPKPPEPTYVAPAPVVVQPPPPLPPPPPPPVESTKKSAYRERLNTREVLFCLPGKLVQGRDEIYDEPVNRLQFGNPFKFEAVIEQNEVSRFSFWTTVDEIEPASIVFFPGYRSWWKIVGSEDDQSGDGAIYSGVPSTMKPDFTNVT